MKKSSSTYFGIILICLIFLHSCTFTQIPDNFFSSATPKNNDSAGGINLGRTFSKLTKDKKLTIGFLGGSITQGDGASNVEETSYSALITKWFTKNYPQANIKSIIAGAPGTGSDLGAFYAIKALKKADLIFIEFAVNDYGIIKSFSNDDEKKNYVMRFTEGIIRGLLIENPAVEIAFIDVASKPTFENYELGTLPLVVQSHQELANHYTIEGQNYILYTNPGYAMFKYVNEGEGPLVGGANALTVDGAHPNDLGHKLIAQKVIDKLQEALKHSSPLPPFQNLPKSISPSPVMHGQMASLKGIQHDSNWTFESTKLGSGVISENYLIATAMGATLSTTFSDSKYLGITYLFVPKGGNIEVRIDDGPQSVVSTDRKIAGVGYVILATNLPPGSHRLTIRVSSLPVMLFGILINPE